MRTLTISLSSQQANRLKRAVETGAYASSSEVVRDALRLWERREEIRSLEIERLKRAYEEGLASGEGKKIDAADFLAELKAEARSRA